MIGEAQLLVMLLAPGTSAAAAHAFLQQLANLQTLPVPPTTRPVRGDWNLRQGPSVSSALVGAAYQGQLFEQWGQVAEWVLVRDLPHEVGGWLHVKAFDA